MSWPLVKPPWKHVKWLAWGPPQTNMWIVPPKLEHSESITVQDTSGVLYNLKQQIESLDSKSEWEFLKRSSNPYELVFSQSQDTRIPSSVCSLRPLSRSFFKMVEILTVMDFFKRHQINAKKPTIRSAHVCEGPGGFIEALLHLSTKNSWTLESAWAMTLKPSKANIPGWKRAYHFLRKAPMVSIEYGADETGDITVPANQAAFLEKARGKCTLFTADGGFDFSEHYSTQEEEVFSLLVSSALIGLQTMLKGGDFVLKIFDTELKATKELIAILAFCFDSWTLYKPALSRPCNAEKYFLGRGCRFVPAWIMKTLTEMCSILKNGSEQHIHSIFPLVPAHIVHAIEGLKKEYLEQQVAAVEYAISHKGEWNAEPHLIWKSIHDQSVTWCREFQMPLKPFSVFQPALGRSIEETGLRRAISDPPTQASRMSLEDADQPE
jgi:FtsJ-like methyltransferase